MDANTIFKTVLHQIESSHLNYAITKTPFSASISLRSSFVKRFDKCEQNQDHDMNHGLTVKSAKVKSEPADDKPKINEELKIVRRQKDDLEALLKSEKVKVETLERELSKVKEEIRSEKSASNSRFKNFTSEISALSLSNKNLEEKLEVKVKALKVKDEACKEFKGAKADYEKRLEESLLELKNAKCVKQSLLCDLCEFESKSQVAFKEHVRRYHLREQRTQTSLDGIKSVEKDWEHPCFYCDKIIISSEDLQFHKCEYHEQWLCDSEYQEDFNLFQCDDCGAECENKTDLDGHISSYHELGTFYCNICPLKFSTNGDLYFHKQRCHEE